MSEPQENPPYPDFTIPPIYKSFIDDLYDYMLRQRSVQGAGITLTDAPGGGKLINANPGGPGSGVVDFQFKVYLKQAADKSWQRGVSFSSTVQQSFDYTDTVTITGLLGSLKPPATDPGWATTNPTDVVWIEWDVDASAYPFTFSGFKIQSLAAGQTWDGGEVEYHMESAGPPPVYAQTKGRLVIAEMAPDPTTPANPIVDDQAVSNKLRMEYRPFDGALDSSGSNPQPVLAAYLFPTG